MKKEIIDIIKPLLKVKSIITFVILAIFSILALKNAISGEDVKAAFFTIIGFYFGTQHEKANKEQ